MAAMIEGNSRYPTPKPQIFTKSFKKRDTLIYVFKIIGLINIVMCKIPSSTHSCVLRGPSATIPEIPSHEVWTDIVSLCLPGRSLTWMGIFTDVALSSVSSSSSAFC